MLSWIIQMSVISLVLIILIHYLFTFFKTNLTIPKVKDLVNKHNNLLYAVPYQHFTNSIENYFSMLKSRLQKLDGLKYENLKENIQKVISEIPKEKYENIFKGAYERPEKYVPKNKTRKIKKNYK